MKLSVRIIGLVLAAFLLVGCSPSPEAKIKTYLDLVKSDYMNVYNQKYFTEDNLVQDEAFDLNSDEDNNELTQIISTYLTDFEYEILESKVDGNQATVIVRFTTYPMNEVLASWFASVIQYAFANAFSDDFNDDDMDQKSIELFNETILEFEKNRVTIATAYLVKNDNEWVFESTEDNVAFINALTGGLSDFAEAMNQDD